MRSPLVLCVLAAATAPFVSHAHTVSLVVDPHAGPPAQHGVAVLRAALEQQGWTVETPATVGAATGERIVTASVGPKSAGGVAFPANLPEALAVETGTLAGKPALELSGADERGLMYAALDVADRVGWSSDPANPFAHVQAVREQPFVRDRSLSVYTMNRAHWESRFYDEAYWSKYFDLLAADRFNRFLIIFGYENGGFLAPPYPYFFNTPGFDNVHMVGLSPEQQTRNLHALNRLIELAHARGIAVSLGIWDHIYRAGVQTGGAEWLAEYNGRSVPNTVEGVTTDNLNRYTLASLKELLQRVPGVDGIQFRIHEESGLKREEMDGFWRIVFTEMQKLRPGLLLEARAKGTPDSVIDTALELGVNLRVETKYWMEQMGLPFHPVHVNPPDQMNRRHGYADLLRYPQRYQIDWRLWNGGTARVLLWGDPEYVRRYGASTALYQSPNWDVQEPLATKMEAQRPDMPDFKLMPPQHRYYDYEFERYWHFYQLWGRLGYNPHTPAEVWDREFARRFGPAGADVAAGLHRASEVLPMIVAAVYPYRLFPTTRGWAERQSLGTALASYAKNEGTDTELFESFADAAKRIATGGATARRTPELTSQWFDATADAILADVRQAESKVQNRSKEFESTTVDLKMLAQLARFHARRAIAAVHYNLFLQTRHLPELTQAVAEERAAVAAWRTLVEDAGDFYTSDLAMGARNYDLCGHWRDELTLLEADLKELEAQCCPPDPADAAKAWQPQVIRLAQLPQVEHQRIATAKPGEALRLVVHVTNASIVQSVKVKYRHVTQYENYQTAELWPTGKTGTYAGTIPGDAISAKWDFMYFIEATTRSGQGTHWPDPLQEMPYVIVKVAR